MANNSKLNSIRRTPSYQTKFKSTSSTFSSFRQKTFYFNIFLKSDLLGDFLTDEEKNSNDQNPDPTIVEDEKLNSSSFSIQMKNAQQQNSNNDSSTMAEDNSNSPQSSTHLKVTSASYNSTNNRPPKQQKKSASFSSSLESENQRSTLSTSKDLGIVDDDIEGDDGEDSASGRLINNTTPKDVRVVEVSLLVNLIELICSPKCKSNFYIGILSLMLIHFWILSTYMVGYLASPSTYSSYFGTEKYDISMSPVSYLVEVLAALVGGIGTALFFKNMILVVFENSHLVETGSSFGDTRDSKVKNFEPKRMSLQPHQEKLNAQKSEGLYISCSFATFRIEFL